MIDESRVRGWYGIPSVRWNILQRLMCREMCYTKAKADGEFHVRSMSMMSDEVLERHLCNEEYLIQDLFSSLAVYPIEALREAHSAHRRKAMFSSVKPDRYPIAFDFDTHDESELGDVGENALSLARLLFESGVKSEAVFSGGKGWHVNTDHYVAADPERKDNGVNKWRKLCLGLAGGLGADPAIYSARREWRCEYSLHHSGRVCFPVTAGMLVEFIHDHAENGLGEWFSPLWVMRNAPLFNRGVVFLDGTHVPPVREWCVNEWKTR